MSSRPEFLVFSDLHLHCWKYGASIDPNTGMNTRLLHQQEVLRQIYRYALDNHIGHVFFCGDLFHTHGTIHVGPLMVANDALWKASENGIATYLLSGNHDTSDRNGHLSSVYSLTKRPYVHPIKWESILKMWERDVLFMSWTQDAELLQRQVESAAPGSLLFLHAGVKGASLNSLGFALNEELLDPDWIPDHVEHAFIGHYHSFRTTPKWTIPGSPMHLTWTDADESRGFLHVKLDPLEILPIGLNFPRFKVLDAAQELDPVDIGGNFLKLTGVEDPSSKRAQDFARELRNAGAITVEFDVHLNDQAAPSLPGEAGSVTIDNVVQKFVEHRKLDSALVSIGSQLMAGTYAAPQG